MSSPKQTTQNLSATFFDACGVEVETVEGPADVVIAAAMRFMRAHGASEDGDADAGSIEFRPID